MRREDRSLQDHCAVFAIYSSYSLFLSVCVASWLLTRCTRARKVFAGSLTILGALQVLVRVYIFDPSPHLARYFCASLVRLLEPLTPTRSPRNASGLICHKLPSRKAWCLGWGWSRALHSALTEDNTRGARNPLSEAPEVGAASAVVPA